MKQNRDSEGASPAKAGGVTERRVKPAQRKQTARETVGCSVWFGILWLNYAIRIGVWWFRLGRLQLRNFLLQLRMRILEFRMALCKTIIICRKRGYLSGNESDLRSNGVLCCVGINHPVEIINVLLECIHEHFSLPNAKLTHGSLAAADGSTTGQGEGAEAAEAASVTEPVEL